MLYAIKFYIYQNNKTKNHADALFVVYYHM
jgi:hypothetical protein